MAKLAVVQRLLIEKTGGPSNFSFVGEMKEAYVFR